MQTISTGLMHVFALIKCVCTQPFPFDPFAPTHPCVVGCVQMSHDGIGAMMTGCEDGMFRPDEKTQDRVDVLLPKKYYGHPNRKRAIVDNDPRQCVWKNPTIDPSVVNGQELYQAPLLMMPSSMGGIIEYAADYFDRQLRGNLIAVKYTSSISRIILRPDGLGVIPQSIPALPLGIGSKGLSLTQAPDGTLVDIRYNTNSVFYHKPVEAISATLKVFAVFPRRGHALGGYVLSVYGQNFDNSTTVTIAGEHGGDVDCPTISMDNSVLLTCSMPPGDRGSTVHVIVSNGSTGKTYEFRRGFRYISGIPP
jgi:IPT/TIG domain